MFFSHAPAGPSPLAALAARLLSAFKDRPAERSLAVEERLLLGGKKSVTLLACHGRRFLLAASGDALAPLIEVRPVVREAGVWERSASPAPEAEGWDAHGPKGEAR